MKKSRYTETQIIKILKEVEGGRLIKEVSREYGISEATHPWEIYINVPDIKKPRT